MDAILMSALIPSYLSSLASALVFLGFISSADAARPIAEVAKVYGDRQNQLIGYGLVVGLDGSGDKSQSKVHATIGS